MPDSRLHRSAAAFVLAAAALLQFGCASHNKRTRELMDAYTAGDYPTAAAAAQVYAEKAPSRDRLVAMLELGAAQRAAGDFTASIKTLDEADALFEKFDQEAKVKLSREAIAGVTNLATLPYQGYAYDRIMMNVLKALNYLEAGDPDHARNELKRVAFDQQISIDRFREKMENLKEASTKEDEQARENPELKSELASQYKELDDLPNQSERELYVNPFAEYLQGIFYLYAGDNSDRSVGRTAMRNVGGMVKNAYIDQDVAAAEDLSEGADIKPLTFVIFETGLAPMRGEFVVRFSVPVRGNYVKFKAAFPVLRRSTLPPGRLLVECGENKYETATVGDMNRVIAQEFKNDLPGVITRTMITASVQAAAAWGAREAANRSNRGRGSGVSGLTALATDLYQEAAAKADLRTWRTLPGQFQIARFETPADRKVSLTLNGGRVEGLELIPAKVNVIYVKSIGAGDRPLVRQFKLR